MDKEALTGMVMVRGEMVALGEMVVVDSAEVVEILEWGVLAMEVDEVVP